MARPQCTGVAATYCPRHGDCTCPPRFPEGSLLTAGERTLDDPSCPLHSPESNHPIGAPS